MPIDEHSLKAFFAIRKIDGVGDVGASKLLKHFNNPKELFSADTKTLIASGLRQKSIASIQTIDFEQFDPLFEWLEKPNRHIITIDSPYYPPLLKQTATPPIFLFAIGNIERLLDPQIAVIGSRSPTHQGISNTQNFCQALVSQGFTITSGLALGIDGEAHRAALNHGGYTVAVTGTGLDRVYPAIHHKLAHQIAENGLIISECFPDEKVHAGCFPRRNRIIAGLSLGTLVIEAAEKSGSLITARIAMEEAREVFAIPGAIHNQMAKGCHHLIKQGAKLTETIDDIINEIPSLAHAQHQATQTDTRPQLNTETTTFLNFIDYETTSLDTITLRSQLSIESATNKLLLLELDGWVKNTAGGYCRI